MPINSEIDLKNGLTIFTADGNPSFQEFMTAVKSFYDGNPTPNVLWNINQASVWDITGEEIKKLAQFAPRKEKAKPGSKTAFVAPDELSNSLSKLFILFGQSKELKIQLKVFKTFEEALSWIKAD